MQVHNVNLPITVTGRHVEVTAAMREYAQKKVEGLHLDYPRICLLYTSPSPRDRG